MGKSITKTDFNAKDFHRFNRKLHDCLDVLTQVLDRPGFGEGGASIGAELELYLLDSLAAPLPENVAVKRMFDDPQLTLELNRYNLEYNLTPVAAAGMPFSALESQMLAVLEKLRSITEQYQGSVLPIGILPTLRREDFGAAAMTDEPRYHALAKVLRETRDQSFGINIDGEDPIRLVQDDVTLEGACTSFQVHYRVAHERFVALWNSIQLVTPLVLGVAVNSPLLFGHRLWHETRVPLFKQSIDGRAATGFCWRDPARVNFGHGWARNHPIELFRENVLLYKTLIPEVSDEDPQAVFDSGNVPRLAELALHDSTIWSWNRPIYDPVDGGHLRIEMRVLPAGPTAVDMAANAAFLIGLAEGLADNVDGLINALPFSYAEYNFYRAAQLGLDARILWPNARQNGLCERPLAQVAKELLEVAATGLASLGVDWKEARRFLFIIEQRLQMGCTGAAWQLREYSRLRRRESTRGAACQRVVRAYQTRSMANMPVATWGKLDE